MPNRKSSGTQNEKTVTEAMKHSTDGKAGQKGDSGNNKSHVKANKEVGAGGGKKQERHH